MPPARRRPKNEEVDVRDEFVLTSLEARQAPAEPLTTVIDVYGLIKGSKHTQAVDLKIDSPTTAQPIRLFSLIRSLHQDAQVQIGPRTWIG